MKEIGVFSNESGEAILRCASWELPLQKVVLQVTLPSGALADFSLQGVPDMDCQFDLDGPQVIAVMNLIQKERELADQSTEEFGGSTESGERNPPD